MNFIILKLLSIRKVILISISSYCDIKNNNYKKGFVPNRQKINNFCGANVFDILAQGDKALNENRIEEALKYYQEALRLAPDNTEINRKLGKTYHKLKEYDLAEENFKIYLKSNEKDAEAWIELGESQRQKAAYKEAKKSFEKALSIEPKNDLARRSILETENNILSCFSSQKAYEEKQEYSQNNLKEALKMAVEYMTPAYMQDLANVQIKYGETASMGGTSNIAQYEDAIKTITISNAYKYASPQVIAAYLVHESVHAKDADPYTSVREEQDAYEIATKFWIKYSNGVNDPEMDYAADLYKKSPSKLRDRVEEIYVLRDPSIAKTSPNHPPGKKNFFNFSKQNTASQSIKKYDVIA